MIEIDKKAKKILFNYFWKNGWIDDKKIFINDDLVRDYDFRYLIKRDNVYYIDLIILLKNRMD